MRVVCVFALLCVLAILNGSTLTAAAASPFGRKCLQRYKHAFMGLVGPNVGSRRVLVENKYIHTHTHKRRDALKYIFSAHAAPKTAQHFARSTTESYTNHRPTHTPIHTHTQIKLMRFGPRQLIRANILNS